jgi:hypothetical protein
MDASNTFHWEKFSYNETIERNKIVSIDNNNVLYVGFGEADITPTDKTVEVYGQYYQRVATGIHSRLKASVLILKQHNECSAMISLDVVGVSEDYCARLQKSIVKTYPGITADKVIINAIHTHSAPGLRTGRDWWKPHPDAMKVEEYQDLVDKKILAAVKQAWNSLRPGGISNVMDYARIGHCRRAVYSNEKAEMYGRTDRDDFTGMEGGEDSNVDLLFFFDENKKPIGIIVNVACPSQVMESTYKISSDFMGALREKLKIEFGSEFVTIAQISAAGCQSPRDLIRQEYSDFWREEGVEVLSERLFDAVKRAYPISVESIRYNEFMKHSLRKLGLPRRRASYTDYVTAKNEMARLEVIQDSATAFEEFCAETHANEKIPERPGPYDSKLHHFVQIRNCEAIIKRYETQNTEPDFIMSLHVLRLGDVVFATNPFELYLDFGQCMKARSLAGQTFVVQLANGIGIYLPSKRAEELGGYGGEIINGIVGADGGRMLVDETVSDIKKVFESSCDGEL